MGSPVADTTDEPLVWSLVGADLARLKELVATRTQPALNDYLISVIGDLLDRYDAGWVGHPFDLQKIVVRVPVDVLLGLVDVLSAEQQHYLPVVLLRYYRISRDGIMAAIAALSPSPRVDALYAATAAAFDKRSRDAEYTTAVVTAITARDCTALEGLCTDAHFATAVHATGMFDPLSQLVASATTDVNGPTPALRCEYAQLLAECMEWPRSKRQAYPESNRVVLDIYLANTAARCRGGSGQ
jgi:hypothetical protein